MERLGRGDLRRLVGFLDGLYAHHDLDGLVDYVVRDLARVIPSDSSVYNEANVRRRRVVWREEPSIAASFPDANRIFERHMPEHPLIAHREWDGRAVRMSDFLSRPRFHDLGLYQEFFRRLDLEHQLSIRLPAPPPLLVVVCLNRRRRDFSGRERLLLELLRPHLVQAYRTADAVTELRRGVGLVDRLGRGLVVASGDGRIRFATDQAARWLDRYFPGRRAGERLPPSLRDFIRHQEAALRADGDAPVAREPLVVENGAGQLVVRLVTDAGRSLLLLEEHPRPARGPGLDAHGLTRRETDVLAWVAEGKTNPEIAEILGLSPRTVGNHLARIYARLGVETRTAAARVALTGR
jgi:DNA-binding CsgD family transcriptional regulator